MTRPPARRAAIICRAGSLHSLTRRLRDLGWDVVRVETIRIEAAPTGRRPAWLRRTPPADLWVVTSRAIVDPVLRVHPKWVADLRRIPETVAIGDDTARALERIGVGPIRVAPRGGSSDLLRTMWPVRGRRVLYLRSDRAGPSLARHLRRRGARVIDRVVYRIREGPPLSPSARQKLAESETWVISSPSALEGLRRTLGPAAFDAKVREARCFALGERTARAIREAGARRVMAARTSTQEGLTKLLEKELTDGSHGRA